MARVVPGVAAGWIVWFAGFLALAILLAAVWPEYRVHGQAWMNNRIFDFPTDMALFYAEWANIPAWYTAVVIAAIPAVLLGARLAGRSAHPVRPAPAT